MDYGKNTVFVTGQSKPAKDDAINYIYQVFYLSLVIEKETGVIIDADCNTILGVTNRFIQSMLIGRNIKTELEDLEREIKARYFALTQKALAASLKDAYNHYTVACEPRQSGLT